MFLFCKFDVILKLFVGKEQGIYQTITEMIYVYFSLLLHCFALWLTIAVYITAGSNYFYASSVGYSFFYLSLPSFLADIILYATIYVFKEGKHYRTTFTHKLYTLIAIIHLIVTLSVIILVRNEILINDIYSFFGNELVLCYQK